jgi:hypothetical protein
MICDLMTLPDQDNPNREIYNTAYSGIALNAWYGAVLLAISSNFYRTAVIDASRFFRYRGQKIDCK